MILFSKENLRRLFKKRRS